MHAHLPACTPAAATSSSSSHLSRPLSLPACSSSRCSSSGRRIAAAAAVSSLPDQLVLARAGCGLWLPAQHQQQQQQPQRRQLVLTRAGFGGFGAKSKGGGSTSKGKDCPCGSGKLYSECCQVYHKGAAAHPDTPERLIRARYSAFVKQLPKYVRGTCHPDNPALKGSSVTLPDGTDRQCTFEEDFAMSVLALQFVGGVEVTAKSSSSADGDDSCTVDTRMRFKRVIDAQGKRVADPPEEVWMERAALVRDDEGHWLVRDVQPLQAPAGGGPAKK